MSNLFIIFMILAIVLPSAHAQRRLIERLRVAGATRPESAVALDGIGRWEAMLLNRFLRVGVIVKTESGAYFLDEAKLVAYKVGKMRQILILAGVLLIAAGVLMWFVQRDAR